MPSKSFKSKKSASRKQKKNKNTKRRSKYLKKSQRGGRTTKPHTTKMQSGSEYHAGTNHPAITKMQMGGRTTKPHTIKMQSGSEHHAGTNYPAGTNHQAITKKQMGGSPASNLVMEATTQPPVTNDYFPRTDSGNSGCMAGGTASDMVMANLTDNATTMKYPPGLEVKGDINSLNTYELTGGKSGNKRKNGGKTNKNHSKSNNHHKNHKKNKNKSNSQNKRNNKNKNSKYNHKHKNHSMKGGYASDWISSQYSQGSINGSSMTGNTGDFSVSQGTARDILMNPPTLGLAGSGYPMGKLEGANVHSVGAPLV